MDEKYYEKLFYNEYPYLFIYKAKSVLWRDFFIYIKKCNEALLKEYGFPYFRLSTSYNPDSFYKSLKSGTISSYEIWRYGLRYAVEAKSPELIRYCLSKGDILTKPIMGLLWAVRNNIKEMVDYFLSNYLFSMNEIDTCLMYTSDQQIIVNLMSAKLEVCTL